MEKNHQILQERINQLEKQLQAEKNKQSKWAQCLDLIDDAVFLINTDFQIEHSNQAARKLFGLAETDFDRKKCYQLLHPEQNPDEFCPFRQMQQGKTHPETVFTRNGRKFTVKTSPLTNEKGEVTHFLEQIQEITELSQTRHELQQVKEHFKNIVEQSGDGISIVNQHGKIIEWNRKQEEITGIRRHQALDQFLWDVQYQIAAPENQKPEIFEFFKKLISESLHANNSKWFYTPHSSPICRPDGTRRTIQTVVFPIRYNENSYIGSTTRDITQDIEIQKKNCQNQTLLKAIFDKSTQALLVLTPELEIEKFNDKAQNEMSLLFSAEIQKGNSFVAMLPPPDGEAFREAARRVLKGEHIHTTRQIKQHYYELILSPLALKTNSISGIFLTALDITVHTIREKELQKQNQTLETRHRELEVLNHLLSENEQKYKTIFNNSPLGIFRATPGGKFMEVNRAFAKMFGYKSAREILAKSKEFSKKFFIKNIEKQIPENIDQTHVTQYLNRYRKRDGSEFVANVYLTEIKDRLHKRVFYEGIIEDITPQIQSQRERESYMKNLSFLNQTALEFLSLPLSENIYQVAGKRLHDLFPQSIIIINSFVSAQKLRTEYIGGLQTYLDKLEKLIGRNPIGKEYQITAQQKKEMIAYSARLYTLKGGIDELTNHAFPLMISKGIEMIIGLNEIQLISLRQGDSIYGTVVFLLRKGEKIDNPSLIETFIHQASIAINRRSIGKQLYSAKLKAEESDKLKSSFLANISHEIRTPMNGITGFTELLNREGLAPEKRQTYINYINESIAQLLEIVTDIVEISKIQAGQLKIFVSTCNINQVFDKLHQEFSERITKTHKNKLEIRLKKHLPDKDAAFTTDCPKLEAILIQLLRNSIKFTPEGYIELGYKPHDQKIVFWVEDTGIGIRKEKLDIIFEHFRQGDEGATRKYGGTGLGLPIAKGLLEKLGGEIWLESQENKGTKVFFALPYHQQLSEKPDLIIVKPEKRQKFDWQTQKVLVVEDDTLNFKYLEEILTETQIQISHAHNGEQAIKMAKTQHFDLILMDIQLPRMNGYQATEQIKKISPETPIIAQTANAMASDRKQSLEAGCDEYIAKPINQIRLLKLMSRFLEKNT